MTSKITIAAVGKFGPKTDAGVWYGVKRPLKADFFKAGQTYEVELETWGDSTKGGFNIINAKLVGDSAPVEQPKAKAEVRKDDKPTQKYWEDKDRSMQMGGLFHDAAALTASLINVHGLTVEAALVGFDEVIRGLIDIREKLDK